MARKKTTRKKPAAPALAGNGAHDLGAELTIRNAADQKARFAVLIKGTGPVTVSAAGLERLDTAGLQLLAAVVVSVGAAGRELRWQAPAAVLLDSAAAVGLSDLLQLPV